MDHLVVGQVVVDNYEKYVTNVQEMNKLRRMAGRIVKNDEDAEDILQETLLKCFKYRDKLKDDKYVYSYFGSAIINNARNLLRYNKKYLRENETKDQEDVVDWALYLTDRDGDLTSLEVNYYNKQIIEKFINKLPAGQRDVAHAFFKESRKKDAADAIGYKENTFKAQFRLVALGYKQWLKDIA